MCKQFCKSDSYVVYLSKYNSSILSFLPKLLFCIDIIQKRQSQTESHYVLQKRAKDISLPTPEAHRAAVKNHQSQVGKEDEEVRNSGITRNLFFMKFWKISSTNNLTCMPGMGRVQRSKGRSKYIARYSHALINTELISFGGQGQPRLKACLKVYKIQILEKRQQVSTKKHGYH